MASDNSDYKLLLGVIDDIKSSLIRLVAYCEVDNNNSSFDDIRLEINKSLSLLDDAVLCSLLMNGQLSLELEPVQLGSVLVDSMNSFYELARRHNCKLEFSKQGSLKPAYTDRRFSTLATRSMLRSLIESNEEDRIIKLKAYSSGNKTVLSFSDGINDFRDINTKSFIKSRYSSQPAPVMGSGSMSGIYISTMILKELGTRLKVGKKLGDNQISASFLTTTQMALI